MKILLTLLTAAISYLLGCFSTGITLSSAQGVDIRKFGSHNTGASNMLRVMGTKNGLATFIGDFAKAMLACLAGSLLLPGATFGIDRFGTLLEGLCAIIGHNWPVFYGFKGGKGVACSVAVILFVDPLLGGISILLCLAVIAITRYISAGSMTMLLSFVLLVLIFRWGNWPLCLFAVILLALCVLRHRANIKRLLNGTENKIGNKVKAK